MAIEVLAWNVQDGFSDPKRLNGLFETIEEVNPDVMAFPEAFAERKHIDNTVLERFRALGYHATYTLYDDSDDRKDRHGMLAATRLTLNHSEIVRLATRNAIMLDVATRERDHDLIFLAVHLDDRHENTRHIQAVALTDYLAEYPGNHHAIAAGDFNAMERNTWLAKLWRSWPARFTAEHLPVEDPNPDGVKSKLGRFGSLHSRLVGMADGGTLKYLHDAGLHNTAFNTEATKGIFTLDYILASHGLHATRQRVLKTSKLLSDHRPLTETIAI